VAKLASGRYHAGRYEHQLVKIKNRCYTQMTSRRELFQSRAGITLTRK
jgi:hypothetical protein